MLVNILNEPWRPADQNFRDGQYAEHDKISGETMRDIIIERKGKPDPCLHIRVHHPVLPSIRDKDGNYVTSGFEYETIWGFGANRCIDDLDMVAEQTTSWTTSELIIETVVAMVMNWNHPSGTRRTFSTAEKNRAATAPAASPVGAVLGIASGYDPSTVVKTQGSSAYDPRVVKREWVSPMQRQPWAVTTPQGSASR